MWLVDYFLIEYTLYSLLLIEYTLYSLLLIEYTLYLLLNTPSTRFSSDTLYSLLLNSLLPCRSYEHLARGGCAAGTQQSIPHRLRPRRALLLTLVACRCDDSSTEGWCH
jgi:hypothetical protein